MSGWRGRTYRLLGIDLRASTYEDALRDLLDVPASGAKARVHFCTVHTMVEAQDNSDLRNVLNTAAAVALDGMPLVWIARWRGIREAQRVCGPDVMLSLCDLGRATGLRHYFLGGQPGIPQRLAERLSTTFPGLAVVGTESPPFRTLSEEEDSAVVTRINAAAPDVLWIGLGSPKQELWAAAHEPALDVPLILPVGAAFDFHSGRIRRAPRWMRRLGLEWLFRLVVEPRRLWKRYVVTNGRFARMLLREELARQRSRA